MAKTKQKTTLNWDIFKIFQELKGQLRHWHIPSVEESSGVSNATLYNWLNGITMYPRLDTISKVADAIGFEIHLVAKKVQPKTRVKKFRVVK